MRISKYTAFFAKRHSPNWSEKDIVIENFKNIVSLTYVIEDLNIKETVGSFEEKELKKKNQAEFRTEEVTRKRIDELYVKWKGHDDFFNS